MPRFKVVDALGRKPDLFFANWLDAVKVRAHANLDLPSPRYYVAPARQPSA